MDTYRKDIVADETDKRLLQAKMIAKAAADVAKGWFAQRQNLTVEQKVTPQDFVTNADKAVEASIKHAIVAAFPGDAILGEEFGSTAGSSGFTWVVDPIDGTAAFLFGQPNWSISIAIMQAGNIVAGVVEATLLGETYHAARGKGAFLNEQPIRMDETWTVKTTVIGMGATDKTDAEPTAAFILNLYKAGGVMFRVGSAAIMMSYVASGKIAGFYDPLLASWDCFAGIVIIEEAGGQVVFGGTMTAPGPLWSGNRAVVQKLREFSGHA